MSLPSLCIIAHNTYHVNTHRQKSSIFLPLRPLLRNKSHCDKSLRRRKSGAILSNPPFSIAAQIVDFYQARGIRFFLFANGLTCGNIAWMRKGLTAVCAGVSILYDNGARVQTNYITNMSPDILAESAPDLHDALEVANRANQREQAKQVTKLCMPDHIVTAARMSYLAGHGTAWQVKAGEGLFVRKLDSYAGSIFGGGLLLSDAIAAERAAAERAAAERVAALRVPLSARERKLVEALGKSAET